METSTFIITMVGIFLVVIAILYILDRQDKEREQARRRQQLREYRQEQQRIARMTQPAYPRAQTVRAPQYGIKAKGRTTTDRLQRAQESTTPSGDSDSYTAAQTTALFTNTDSYSAPSCDTSSYSSSDSGSCSSSDSSSF